MRRDSSSIRTCHLPASSDETRVRDKATLANGNAQLIANCRGEVYPYSIRQ